MIGPQRTGFGQVKLQQTWLGVVINNSCLVLPCIVANTTRRAVITWLLCMSATQCNTAENCRCWLDDWSKRVKGARAVEARVCPGEREMSDTFSWVRWRQQFRQLKVVSAGAAAKPCHLPPSPRLSRRHYTYASVLNHTARDRWLVVDVFIAPSQSTAMQRTALLYGNPSDRLSQASIALKWLDLSSNQGLRAVAGLWTHGVLVTTISTIPMESKSPNIGLLMD